MYNSINYIEINCKYNESDLKRFVGALQNRSAHRSIVYRNRTYIFAYESDENMFYIFNKHNLPIAFVVGDKFKYYPSRAKEIGLDLVFGLLAVLNIYPVKA